VTGVCLHCGDEEIYGIFLKGICLASGAQKHTMGNNYTIVETKTE